jgi:hypothetical protein
MDVQIFAGGGGDVRIFGGGGSIFFGFCVPRRRG